MTKQQSDMWDDVFQTSSQGIEDLLYGNKWTSVQYSPYLPYVAEYVSADKKIHESGCGMGQWLIYLQKEKKCSDLYGIDFARKTIEKMKSRFPTIQFDVGNITNTHYENEFFDVLLSWSVIDHLQIKDQNKAVIDYARILKPGGILFITVPFKNYLYYSPVLILNRTLFKNAWFRKVLGLKPLRENIIQKYYSENEIISLLKQHWFNILQVDFSGFEFGFSKYINAHFLNKTHFFLKNNQKFDGLNKMGNFFVKVFKGMNRRIVADEIFIIAQKK